jgi:hypothetical protein
VRRVSGLSLRASLEPIKLCSCRYGHSILEVCEALHMGHTGTADPFGDHNKRQLVAWLRTRIRQWQPPVSEYDSAVAGLAMATLSEVE